MNNILTPKKFRINHVVWPERRGYWQVRVIDHAAIPGSGKWISYDNVVWC